MTTTWSGRERHHSYPRRTRTIDRSLLHCLLLLQVLLCLLLLVVHKRRRRQLHTATITTTTQGNDTDYRSISTTALLDDEEQDADETSNLTAVQVFSSFNVDDRDENTRSSGVEEPDLVVESLEEDIARLQLLEPIGDLSDNEQQQEEEERPPSQDNDVVFDDDQDEDFLDLNPLQIGEYHSPLLDEFTNDELIAALGNLVTTTTTSEIDIDQDDRGTTQQIHNNNNNDPLPTTIETLPDIDDLLRPLADQEELPDIEFTDVFAGNTETADENLLLPIEDSIFDYFYNNEDSSSSASTNNPEQPLSPHGGGTGTGTGGSTTLDILDQLGSLTLTDNSSSSSNLDKSKEQVNTSQERTTEQNQQHQTDIPPWFYCQPCEDQESPLPFLSQLPPTAAAGTSPRLASISESQPLLSDQQQQEEEASSCPCCSGAVHQSVFDAFPDFDDRDIDALLQLSQLTLEDPPANDPPPEEKMAPPEEKDETKAAEEHLKDEESRPSADQQQQVDTSTTGSTPVDDEPNTSRRSQRPGALRAAIPFLSTFDTELYSDNNGENDGTSRKQSKSKMLKSERSCLGHKERIMGLDFSECGRYLATAAADSTIRIWGVAQNKLLATLKQHDEKFECLRVAWASSLWGQDRLPRSGGAKSAVAAIAAAAAAAAPGSDTTTTGSLKSDGGVNQKGDFNYLLATGGADGVVYLWGCADPTDESSWTVYETLDHTKYSHFQETEDENDRPQVYSLQFIDHWKALPSAMTDDANSFLMTSSDDHVHLWEVDNQKRAKSEDGSVENKLNLREVFSLRFADMHSYGYGVSVGQVTGKGLMPSPADAAISGDAGAGAISGMGTSTNDHVFGGTDRNPQGLVYVFDASYCPANGLLGVALSDGSLRVIHGRGVCLSILQLPGVKAHLTSFAWDSSGRHLATSVATGHVITWGIEWDEEPQHSAGCGLAAAETTTTAAPTWGSGGGGTSTSLRTICKAVLEGGHQRGRPLFGVRYCGTDENLLISWGVDGRLCLWDAHSDVEQVEAPLATLLDKNKDGGGGGGGEYPIYCVSLSPITDDDDCIAVGGGDSKGGILGIPVYLYNVRHSVNADEGLKKADSKSSIKKAKTSSTEEAQKTE